jgi:hypothetical protein
MAQWQITGAQHCHLRLCPNQPLFQLLQHIHFAWYVNFKFSNLITLKKVNIQKLIWQYNHLMSKQLPLSRYQHQMTCIDIDKA